jgi:phage FluMu protein Com
VSINNQTTAKDVQRTVAIEMTASPTNEVTSTSSPSCKAMGIRIQIRCPGCFVATNMTLSTEQQQQLEKKNKKIGRGREKNM